MHMIDKLRHQLQKNDQRTPLVTPARIHILVGISNHHGLHRETRGERPRFEGDDGFAVGRGALGKQHNVRPPVVDRSSPDMSSRVMPGLRIDSIHRNDLSNWEHRQYLNLSSYVYRNECKLTCKAWRNMPMMGISTFSFAETMTGKWR